MHPVPPKILLAGILLAAVSPAFGLGFRIPDQGSAATARGDAFAATADDPSAIYYNPAGITQLRGTEVLMGSYGIMFNTRVSLDAPGSNTFDNKYDPQAAPHFFITYRPEKGPIAYGLGIYAPFGFKNEYADDVPFRTIATQGSIQNLVINPVVALQVSKSFSVAVGLTVNYGTGELERGVIAPGDEFRFEGDNWAVGFNAGVMWQPHRMHSFGVTYHSPVDLDLEGTSHLYYKDVVVPVEVAPGVVQNFVAVPGVDQREHATAGFRIPQHITLGYSFRPAEDWNFEVNVDWTDWDNLNTITLHQESGDLQIPFNWQSSFMYEFGVTKKFNDWHVSAGYVFSENSVPDESFTPLVPDSDRHILAFGFGRKMDRLRWDLAYQYTWGPKRSISQGTLADGDYRFESHALTVSLGYRF